MVCGETAFFHIVKRVIMTTYTFAPPDPNEFIDTRRGPSQGQSGMCKYLLKG